MKKRVSLLTACFLLVFLLAPLAAGEPAEYTSGDWTYILLSDGTAEITAYQGSDGHVLIPGRLDGIQVTSIGEYAFSSLAFLESAVIPDGVVTIRDGAFYLCGALAEVTFPDSLTGIGSWAFYACESLAAAALPDGLTSIGDWAFSGCLSLTGITIPDQTEHVGRNPFSDCEKLAEIIVSGGHPYLETIDGVLFSKPDRRIVTYPGTLTADAYSIPEGTQIIGDYAFSANPSLTRITIPDSVTAISDWGFYSCEFLTELAIPDSVTSIGYEALKYCDSLTVTVGQDSVAKQYCLDNDIPYTCR